MDHDTLAALFRRIVLASAPLLSAGCDNHTCRNPDIDASFRVNGAPPDAAAMDGGYADLLARCQANPSDCEPLCRTALPQSQTVFLKQCELVTSDGGALEVRVVYVHPCVGGRCPAGLATPTPADGSNPLGAWLAMCAHLEAASIDAFEILAAELDAHHSPQHLIRAARAAACDERRHARIMGGLAARHGSIAPPVHVARGPIRDIETIARENAIEGCTRETYAALVASRQARVAANPAIRAAMVGIARDETRHAALAWAVDAWASARLGRPARRRVREARHDAGETLLTEISTGLSPDARDQAGLPGNDEAARLAASLHAALPS
jgi:hypothetical protein